MQTSWPVVVVRNPGGVRRHGGKGTSILHRLVVDPVLKLVNSNLLLRLVRALRNGYWRPPSLR